MKDLEFNYLYQKYAHLLPSKDRDIYLLREAIFGFSVMKQYLEDLEGKVLEVGCGPGLLLNELSDMFPKNSYLGVDPFISSYEKFSNILDSINKVKFVKSKIEDFDTNEKFDLIFSINVCEHVESWKSYIKKTQSLLTPNGVSIILCPTYDLPYETHVIIPIIINKDITYKIFEKKIRDYEENLGIQGNWESVNFIKARHVKKFLNNTYQGTFDYNIHDRLFKRFTHDNFFLERHGLLGRFCQFLYKIRLNKLIFNILKIPFPYMKVEIKNFLK